MKNKNKNKNKAIKEELFKPYILPHSEKSVLDTNVDTTYTKLREANIKTKKEMVTYERCKYCRGIFEKGTECEYCKKVSKECWVDYDENWKDILEIDGKIDMEQLVRELSDYTTLMENVNKVYCHITNNSMSKPGYDAQTIIACADDSYAENIEGCIKEDINNIFDYNLSDKDKLEEIKEYINELRG